MNQTMRVGRSVLLLAGMLTFGVCTLQAQDIFKSTNGNWNATGNWSLSSLPGTNTAIIGDYASGYPSNAIANINNGDSLTCGNLYLGYNSRAATGTLNITGGTLLVTGTCYCASGAGTGPGGVIMQTGGAMTNIGGAYLTYSAGVGTWTVAGGTLVNMGAFNMGHFGGTGTLTVSGGVVSNASTTIFGYGGYKNVGTLIVTNTGVLYLSGGLTFSPGGGATDTVSQSSGTLIIATNAILTGSQGGYTAWTMTGGVLTNTSTLGIAYDGGGGGGCTDTWTMTGGVWSNQGLITVSLAGNGIMNMNGGTLIAQGGITCPGSRGGTGAVVQTSGVIVSGGNIIIGTAASSSTGLWTMAGGVMTNNGALYVGEGIQPGALVINNGTWWQGSSLYVGGTATAAGTGVMTVANGTFLSQANVFVAAHGSGAYGTLLITNATFTSTNANTAFKIGTNGIVTVCGTQRVFQVASFTNYAGLFSNNIAQVAGGLDITTTNAGALTINPNGLVTLVFSQDPLTPGNYWGLRWLGTTHVAALMAMYSASQLTWDDSQLSAVYQGQTCIYTDAVYTYVGINVTTLPTVTTILVSPASAIVMNGNTQQYMASGVDQFGFPIPAAVAWSVNGGGTFTTAGLFSATAVGGFTVQASNGSVAGAASVIVIAPPPPLLVVPVSTNSDSTTNSPLLGSGTSTASQYAYLDNGDGTCTITGYAGSGGAILIPSTIHGLFVASIGGSAFAHCATVTSITFPNSVTNIGCYAFAWCSNLTAVAIGNGVRSIGYQAFASCANLTSLALGNNLASIESWAFANCGLGRILTIPASVTHIGDGAFCNCLNLHLGFMVSLSNPVYTSGSFDGMPLFDVLLDKAQTTLIACPAGFYGVYIIPDGVTRIENMAFGGCTNLTGVVLPSSYYTYGDPVDKILCWARQEGCFFDVLYPSSNPYHPYWLVVSKDPSP